MHQMSLAVVLEPEPGRQKLGTKYAHLLSNYVFGLLYDQYEPHRYIPEVSLA
jgi:hypothetical protein